MKKISIIIFLASITTAGFSQRFDHAIGLRGGYGSGITYKHNLGNVTLEGIGAFRAYYSYFGLLAEKYTPLSIDLPGTFNLFYGGGAHIARARFNYLGVHRNKAFFGFDGIIGLEYEIDDYPLHVSIDVKPEFNVGGYGLDFGSALSLRYEF